MLLLLIVQVGITSGTPMRALLFIGMHVPFISRAATLQMLGLRVVVNIRVIRLIVLVVLIAVWMRVAATVLHKLGLLELIMRLLLFLGVRHSIVHFGLTVLLAAVPVSSLKHAWVGLLVSVIRLGLKLGCVFS